LTSNRSCASAPARPAKMRFDTGEKFMFTHYSLKKLFGALGMLLLATLPMLAFGDEAAAPAPTPDKGDTSWMLVSTALVLMMSVPALALFYGGMVRSKNALSVLMQVFVVFSLITVLWCVYGYSLAFTEGNAFFGGFDRLFLK